MYKNSNVCKENKNKINLNNIKYNYEYKDEYPNDNTCAMDIGGTLIKLVYINNNLIVNKNNCLCENKEKKQLYIKLKENKYLFCEYYKKNKLDICLNFILKNDLIKNKLLLTGGGAFKYFFYIIETILKWKLFNNIVKYNNIYDNKNDYFDNINKIYNINEKNINNEEYIIYISNKYYCEDTLTLYLKIYIEKNNINNKHNKLNKNIIDYYENCGTVKFYLTEEENLNKNETLINNVDYFNNLKLFLQISKKDEMDSIVNGIFILFHISKTILKYNQSIQYFYPIQINKNKSLYPFILVNIGSGISILKFENSFKYERITGTAIGGGTVIGLANLILGKISFKKLIKLAKYGTNDFDLLYKYCKENENDFLSQKLFNFNSINILKKYIKKKKKYSLTDQQNIAKSLITMVSYNVTQLVYIMSIIHNIKRIFFSGTFINNNKLIMKSLIDGLNYIHNQYIFQKKIKKNLNKNNVINNLNSFDKNENYKEINNFKNEKDKIPKLYFLSHDTYLGCIGCFFS